MVKLYMEATKLPDIAIGEEIYAQSILSMLVTC